MNNKIIDWNIKWKLTTRKKWSSLIENTNETVQPQSSEVLNSMVIMAIEQRIVNTYILLFALRI